MLNSVLQVALLLCTAVWSNAEQNLTNEELECLDKFQYYSENSKQCHELLTRGPCKEGEWFVLRKPQPGDDGVIIKAVCQKDPCVSGGFYHAEKGCVSSSQKDEICGSNDKVKLANNDFGEAECACINTPSPYARLNDDPVNDCYQLYKKGPCEKKFILGIDPESTSSIPKCIKDRCYAESLEKKKNGQLSRSDTLAWHNGSCYKLDTQGPCASGEVFKVSVALRRPLCEKFPQAIFNLEKEDCIVDENGNCQKIVYFNKKPDENTYKEAVIARLKAWKEQQRQISKAQEMQQNKMELRNTMDGKHSRNSSSEYHMNPIE